MQEVVKRYSKNKTGRDYVVGDIHGCFTKLEEALELVNFDRATDRLFSVGDMIDRGPDSDDAVYYLVREKWFHAIRGNHEQMLLDGLNEDYPDAAAFHAKHGGKWFYELPLVERQCTALVLDELPLGIEVETDRGLIGLIHAEVPHCNWNEFKELYADNKEHFESVAMWSRSRLARGTTRQVIGIDHVYVGHSTVSDVITLGNVTYLDTGSGFPGGRLSLMQIQ